MGHIVFLKYATPEHHKKFIQQVNKELAYEYHGKLRHGVHKPFLSEVKMYDIRVKKELIPQVMRDLEISDVSQRSSGPWYSSHFRSVVGKILKIGRKVLGMKTIEPEQGASRIPKISWHCSQLVGVIDDLVENDEEAL